MADTDTHWISLIVPMLNEAGSIQATLNALQPWRALGAELIVVDGGSADGSVALAQPLADQVVIAERGRAAQMNAGALLAGGRYLMFVHADTGLAAINPEHFESRLLARQPAWGRFDVRITGNSIWLGVVAFMMNWRSRLTGIATGDQAIFVQRQIFESIGGFPAQPLMEDIELCRQLGRLKTRHRASAIAYGRPWFVRDRVVTSGRRWEANGVWYTIVCMWRLRWLYWRGTSAEKIATVYHAMKKGG